VKVDEQRPDAPRTARLDGQDADGSGQPVNPWPKRMWTRGPGQGHDHPGDDETLITTTTPSDCTSRRLASGPRPRAGGEPGEHQHDERSRGEERDPAPGRGLPA